MKTVRRHKPKCDEWRCPKCHALHGYFPAGGACATKGCTGVVQIVPLNVPRFGAQRDG